MKLTGIALGVIAAAGIAGVGGAWYTGGRIEADIQERLAQAQQAIAEQQIPGLQLSLQLDSLQRGLFASDATYLLQISVPDGAAVELRVEDHIEHGPFPPSRLSAGQLAPVMSFNQLRLANTPAVQDWYAMAGNQVPLHAVVTTRYDGSFDGRMIAESLTVSGEDGSSLQTTPLSIDMRGSADGETVTVDGHMPTATFTGTSQAGPVKASFNNLRMQSDVARSASGLYLGRNHMGLESIILEAMGDKRVELRDLRHDDNSQEVGGFLDVTSRQQLGAVLYNGQKLGALELAISAGRLQAEPLQALSEQAQEMQRLALSGESTRALKKQIKASLEEVLKGQPELGVDRLALSTANGEAVISLGVALDHPGDLNRSPDQLLMKLIRQLNLRIDVDKAMMQDAMLMKAVVDPSVDNAMLQQDAGMMVEMVSGMLQDMQFATLKDDRLTTSLAYADGMVDFNGRKMPLMQFAAMMQNMAASMPMPGMGSGMGAMDGAEEPEELDGMDEMELQ